MRGANIKAGIGVEKSSRQTWLAGAPVGTRPPPGSHRLHKALLTKGFSRWMGARRPPAVIKPIFTRSRRETLPWEWALRFSARFFRAFLGFTWRAFEAFSDTKKPSHLCSS